MNLLQDKVTHRVERSNQSLLPGPQPARPLRKTTDPHKTCTFCFSTNFGGIDVKRSRLGAMLLCILFASSFAFGQSATTALHGTVKDPAGALVPGATVTLTDKSVDKTITG